MGEIDEVKVDYEEALKKAQENEAKKETKNYTATTYETMQEIFQKSIKEYGKKEFILEKFDAKVKYGEQMLDLKCVENMYLNIYK